MARGNSNRRRRSSRTSDSDAAAGGSTDNPHRPGTNAHSAFERMKRRHARDAEFAKTAEGKRSAAEHNAVVVEDVSTESEDFDPIAHEGRDSVEVDSGTEA